MSDGDRRLRVIALAFAGVAMVVALTAAVFVVRRDATPSEPHAGSAQPPAAQLSDRTVAAGEVVKLQRNSVEVVVENGSVKGVKLKDEALAKTLGLEPGDVITAVSGRPITRDMDLYDVMFNVSMMNATTLYVEIMRAGAPLLIRWRLDGDLKQARYANRGSPLSSLYSAPADPDPLLDTIEKVDDTHVKLPKATVDTVLANPMAYSKGARVVPSIKNGQANGLKLYAIRPNSLYARLGLTNGDTISAVNGEEVTSPDKALEVYTKLRKATEWTLDVTRRGQPMQLTITITK